MLLLFIIIILLGIIIFQYAHKQKNEEKVNQENINNQVCCIEYPVVPDGESYVIYTFVANDQCQILCGTKTHNGQTF